MEHQWFFYKKDFTVRVRHSVHWQNTSDSCEIPNNSGCNLHLWGAGWKRYFMTLLSGFLNLCQQVILLQEVFLHRLPPWNNMRYSISVWCQVRQSWSTVTMGEESCNGYHILVGRILRVMSMSLIMDQPCLWQCMKLGGRKTQKVVISHIVWLLEWVRI